MKHYRAYYEWKSTLFNMQPYLYNREFVVIPPKDANQMSRAIRMLKAQNVENIQFVLDFLSYNRSKKIFNFYSSLAKYKTGVPHVDYKAWALGKKLMNDDWKSNHFESMTGYDFVLDIDARSHEEMDEAHYVAKRVKKIMDFHGVPYELRFSGMGFHFLVTSAILPNLSFDPSVPENIYTFCKRLAMYFEHTCGEMVDTTIYDPRRVIKVPYTLANYDTEEYLCLPFLNGIEFENFELDNMRLLYWISPENKLYRRGTYIFNHGGNMQALIKKIGGDLFETS